MALLNQTTEERKIMTKQAEEFAVKNNLVESGNGALIQSEIDNDDFIDEIQDAAVKCCSDELFVFSDGSCINRQGDEYFVNDDVDYLDQDYLDSVGY